MNMTFLNTLPWAPVTTRPDEAAGADASGTPYEAEGHAGAVRLFVANAATCALLFLTGLACQVVPQLEHAGASITRSALWWSFAITVAMAVYARNRRNRAIGAR